MEENRLKKPVNRFGKILPLWQKIKSLWTTFWMAYLVFGKPMHHVWHFYATGYIVTDLNGQRLKSNKTISSHCSSCTKANFLGKMNVGKLLTFKKFHKVANCK